MTSRRRYDVIIGDLFHPDLVGRSALLSVQQFGRARAHLTADGIFVQWLALNQFSVDTLKVVLRTFRQVYPKNMLFVDGFRLAMVGLNGEWRGIQHVANDSEAALEGPTGGEDGWTWLGRYWGRIHVGTGPIQDEWRPQIEFRLPRARYSGDLDLVKVLSWLEGQRPSLTLASADLHIPAHNAEPFERSYAATALAVRSWKAGIEGRGDLAARLIRFAHRANAGDRAIAWTLADEMYASIDDAVRHGIDRQRALSQILEVFPDHPGALLASARLAEESGDTAEAERLLARYRAIDPLGRVPGVKFTRLHDRLTR